MVPAAGSTSLSRQKVRASGKVTTELDQEAGWGQGALSSPNIGGFGSQAGRCLVLHQSPISRERRMCMVRMAPKEKGTRSPLEKS